MLPPVYPPEAVLPFREELHAVGVTDLLTPEAVDRAVGQPGTALVVINSVCGCAAGAARPAVALALQHKVIPDRLHTVFAGMEREAVERVRALHAVAAPPSSPAVALFKDGKLAGLVSRHQIEGRQAAEIAADLVKLFDAHCAKPGPSIPPEAYAKLKHVVQCGSSIPRVN
jgi:putative YphP/YqiW family bacilliredoxin